jgi:hypothetical protein
MEAWRLKMEGLHCMSVVADSRHFDEEQDTDPYPHPSEKSYPTQDQDSHQSKNSDPNPRQRENMDPHSDPKHGSEFFGTDRCCLSF